MTSNKDALEALQCLVNGSMAALYRADNERFENEKQWVERHEATIRATLREYRDENARFRKALELIAAGKRPDGTYNRCREACEQLAREALTKIQAFKGGVE